MKNRKTLINKTIGGVLLGIALIVMTPITTDEERMVICLMMMMIMMIETQRSEIGEKKRFQLAKIYLIVITICAYNYSPDRW